MKMKQISINKTLHLILPQVFKITPLFFSLFVFVALIHGLSWGVSVTVNQYVFDTVEKALKQNLSINTIWGAMILLAVITILSQIVNALHSFVYTPFNRLTVGHFERKIHQKIGKLPMESFEDPSTLDKINKAKEGVQQIFQLVFNFIMIFTFFVPYVIYMAIYLYFIDHKLSVIILLLVVPIVISQKLKVKLSADLEDESASHRRAMDYYKRCICNREYFKETRILGAFTYFFQLLHSSLGSVIKFKVKFNRKNVVIQLLNDLIVLVGYIAVLYIMIMTVIDNKMSVGAFTAVFMSLKHLIDTLNGLSGISGDMSRCVGPVNNYLEFIASPEKRCGTEEGNFSGDIHLENVTYQYPGTSVNALTDISLHIKGGETIALVGENGAGKTTLARLLIGLYAPTRGVVSIGGVKLTELKDSTSYNQISAVFQNFNKYQMNLKENVSISDVSRCQCEEDIKDALTNAGFTYDYLENGLHTMLSREFGGVDLSGGQWQRIAMARGLFKDHSLIVLDEPTSAIDPIEETRIFEQFTKLSEGITSILITHRLGSTKIADRIYVVDHGHIVEAGNHDELMNNRGKYYDMYSKQSQWYQ